MNNHGPDRLRTPIYHAYQQLVDDLNQLRDLDRRNFVDRSTTSIGQSPNGQWQIPVIKIGKNAAHRVFILGGAHAREWISVEVPYLLAELLVKIGNDIPVHAYYDRYKDKVRRLLQEREVWIVPMLNPEGNTFSHLPGHEGWRKNRRFLSYESYTTHSGDTWDLLYRLFGPGGGNLLMEGMQRRVSTEDRGITNWQEIPQVNAQQLQSRNVSVADPNITLPTGIELRIPVYGVDLNRNFPFQWDTNIDPASGEIITEREDQHDDNYPGTDEASEYETQAVINTFNTADDEDRPFRAALEYHFFAEVVLFPWGYQRTPTDRQAVIDFASYMAGLINQIRSPNYLLEIQHAKQEELGELRRSHGRQINENDLEFLNSWLISDRRQYYFHANPGALGFGEGGSFLDWAHDTRDGMPVYTIELSPRSSRTPSPGIQEPPTRILPVFQENLPAALALIEYGVTQRRSQRRGKLYRCHLFSYGGPQTEGVVSQWSLNLDPIGERTVLTGEVVELFSTIEGDVYPINEQSRVRFDILEEDHILTGGLDDKIISFLGDGVTRGPEGFATQNKRSVFHRLASGQTLHSYVENFKRTQENFQNNILLIEEPRDDDKQYHLLTWWAAQRLEDFASSEFYFIVNVNDAFEDQSNAILDVSSTAIPTGTSLEDKVRGALLRINEQLGTGITDWAVTDNETRAVLQILESLEPTVLLKTVQRMRLASSWNTFRSNLPSSDSVARNRLIALLMKIEPSFGYVMPGDLIHLKVIAVSVGGRVGDAEFDRDFRVRETGVRLPMLSEDVPIVGLLPQDAANRIADAYIDGLILQNPSVVLRIVERGPFYAGSGAVGENESVAFSRLDPNSPRVRRIRKQEEFMNYIQGETGSDPFFVNAHLFYLRWIQDHFESEEFLTRDPVDLWNWALGRASEPPPTTPVMEFLALLERMRARIDETPPEEKRQIQETSSRYLDWLDLHRNDPNLGQHDPVDIWVRAWGQTIDADIQRIRLETERRVLEERRRTELEAHWRAADRKLDEALRLMITRVWQLPEPRSVRDRSRSVDYLIMPSEAERMVRDLMARAFLDNFMQRMGNVEPGFADTTATEDFASWLTANPELSDALWLTQAYPYVEQFAIEREIPGWQIAIEVAVGFIPIVGQVVGAYEVIAGEDLFGNPLSGTERAILGAAILLPAAAKIYKVGRAAVTTSHIASAYRLSAREADALFRATAAIRPGSAGERLLLAAKSDIQAGRSITDPQRIQELGALLQEMGMTERATARALNTARRAAQQAARRVDRLELARTVPNLTEAERNLLESLGEDAWSRLFGYATTRTNAFTTGSAAARTGAISSVKGKIAEELFPLTREFDDVMRAAREQAAREGIHSNSVQFVTNVVSDMPVGSPFPTGELTDGVIVAFHNNKARVLGVIESKSPSNLRDLAAASGEYFGQIEKDLDRFSMFEVSFNGRVFQPEDIIISRHNTQWVGVAPPGLQLGPTHLQRIQSGFSGFRLVNGPIADERLNEVAERLLQVLSQSR